MLQNWKFIENPAQARAWSWVLCKRGCGILRSAQDFETFAACMLDAQRRGFGLADPFDVIRERRRQPRALPVAPETTALTAFRHLPC